MTLDVIVSALLSALLAGILGYTVAVVRRDTAIALLERGQKEITSRLDRVDQMLIGQNEKIDRHLKIMIRLIVDFARKSGIEMRTADVLEISSLDEGALN